MKCRSVACIWSGTPISHKVTATATITNPPTLYTGGSDGSILWWNLSHSNEEVIKPVAMLCGHVAPIADLSICCPVGASMNHGSDRGSDGNSTNDALLSACRDGVLCVWSRGSGHCRRRRRLPPWVGSPHIVRTLATSSRYVCIGCSFDDSVEGSDGLVDNGNGEPQYKNPTKGAVIIVDTYSLTIVQTVFHGNLSIRSLKFMDVVLLGEDGERYSIVMVDSSGRVQFVPILKDPDSVGEGANGLHKISQSEVDVWSNGLSEGRQVVAVATNANIIALVFRHSCIFGLLNSKTTIGEISFMDGLISAEEKSSQSCVLGGMFLGHVEFGNQQNDLQTNENFRKNFVVWNNRGFAVVYAVSNLDGVLKSEIVSEIPTSLHSADAKSSVFFVQLKHYLFRVEAVCIDNEEPLLWNSHVTMWSICEFLDNKRKLSQQCKMLRESASVLDWIPGSGMHHLTVRQTDNDKYDIVRKRHNVSSSMVISENHVVPYGIVYGFFSGEIELVQFDMSPGPDSDSRNLHQGVDSHVSRQYFLGHTAAILCLAAHQMSGAAKGWSFSHVLISGSMDCTIRIWDIETGNLITVMHHHVAQVRQIIFPPSHTERPWSDCFLSVGEDSCAALVSLETLRVERMFPGHPSCPDKVVWDGTRGYIACLCQTHLGTDAGDALYIWDVKTGARERILHGTASHSMLDHFCKGISLNSMSGSVLNGNTSISSLLLPIVEGGNSQSPPNYVKKGIGSSSATSSMKNLMDPATSHGQVNTGSSVKQSFNSSFIIQSINHPIKSTCPFPGIATLVFDLASLMSPCLKHKSWLDDTDINRDEQGTSCSSPKDNSDENGSQTEILQKHELIRSMEECIIRFGLSFLHLWDVDSKLDSLLITDMKLQRPGNFILAAGLQGDKGSLTLTFPGSSAILELWKSSSEFAAMRSLIMVSMAQRMINLCHASSATSSALAAFYTRNFADQVPDVKPPLLQLLVSFWRDESEHVRMAARTLFHCAASRAIPLPLCGKKANDHVKLVRSLSGIGENDSEVTETGGTSKNDSASESQEIFQDEETKVLAWLESFGIQDWISCVGGSSQDAMTSHIIVAAALAVWYPSLVKPSLASLVVHPLIKLVMAMNEKYSSTAAELLAEGMASTWSGCSGFEITRLIGDIFFQIECVSTAPANSAGHPAVPSSIKETLIEVLLPSLAIADIPGFLTVIERQIWSTASDSPVHLVSLKTLIRVVHGSPRNLAQHLDKVIDFILHTMDPGNLVMRKSCFLSAMTTLKEVVRVFPMVALNDSSTRLAVGDAIGEIKNATISIYDMQSVAKVKVLDASGPPGLPDLLSGTSDNMATVISALSFSPGGEGLVAFSEHGLMIRWWSLGSIWWEKLSRNFVPVHCTKLIFVPPWEGFSPNSSRSSIMASMMGNDRQAKLQEKAKDSSNADSMKLLIHNLDLSYRLEWVGERKVRLTRHGQDLGTFPL